MDASATGRPRKLRVRPIAILVLILILPGLGAWAGYKWSADDAFNDVADQAQIQQNLRIQRYQSRLAEADSELALRQSQIEGLKEEMRAQQAQNKQLKQRLDMFESILAAQKMAGVHILKAKVDWQDSATLVYWLILAKGGNLPRRIRGSIRMTAHGPRGQTLVLPLDGGNSELPYQMETHTFLHGSLEWTPDWRPERIVVSRLNRKGVIREEIDIPIGRGET